MRKIFFENDRNRLTAEDGIASGTTIYRLYRSKLDPFYTKHWEEIGTVDQQVKGEWYNQQIAMLLDLLLTALKK